MLADKGEITRLLMSWGDGDRQALEQLMPVVYDELKALGLHYLQMERPDHTLQGTALVHELYLRLVDQGATPWENRRHFFALASRIMRHILIDHARHRAAAKCDHDKAPIEEALTIPVPSGVDLIALDGALESLGRTDMEKLRIVELRFFGGLSVNQTAEILGTSPATVKRHWAVAKAWLYHALNGVRPHVPATTA
jgi:RNA polymerase sigma factor (TIGR02999 family)